MAAYRHEEYADIIFVYGLCDGDAAAARREYEQRFPDRRVPNIAVFYNTFRRLRETGSVSRRISDVGRPRINENIDILECVEADPTISTRQVARRLGISQWQVWHAVHTAQLHPFHYTPVHTLDEGDPLRRIEFCRYLINSEIEEPNYLKRILWTDESMFDRDGITNYHNLHYWAPNGQNPRKKKERANQRRFSLNVWMGVIDNNIIGPFFLPPNLDGVTYANFLENELDVLLEDLPLARLRNMIYQHDGCPAHFFRRVRQWLDLQYPLRWIGRGGPTPWPARSPDLTPCDFYLWGHMKALVYTTPVDSVEELRDRIIRAAEHIKATISTRVTVTEVRRRLRACIRYNGRQFEQYL